jgi:hypothetical protein
MPILAATSPFLNQSSFSVVPLAHKFLFQFLHSVTEINFLLLLFFQCLVTFFNRFSHVLDVICHLLTKLIDDFIHIGTFMRLCDSAKHIMHIASLQTVQYISTDSRRMFVTEDNFHFSRAVRMCHYHHATMSLCPRLSLTLLWTSTHDSQNLC